MIPEIKVSSLKFWMKSINITHHSGWTPIFRCRTWTTFFPWKSCLWGKSEGIIFLSNEADRRGIIGDPATNPLILQHCLEMSTARSSHFQRLQHSLSDNLGSQNGRTLFQLPIRLLNICPPSKLSKSSIGTLWENRRGPDSESHCRSSHNGWENRTFLKFSRTSHTT